jgi:peptide deformylase
MQTATNELLDSDISKESQEPKAKLVVYPSACLRQVSIAVEQGADVSALLSDMWHILRTHNGMGLAAPQIGINRRVIIVDVDDAPGVMINPVIESAMGTVSWAEGCLSVPGQQAIVERKSVIDVSYMTPSWERKQFKATGLAAVCIQHEIDHLDGKLFYDRLSRLRRDMLLKKIRKGKFTLVDRSTAF